MRLYLSRLSMVATAVATVSVGLSVRHSAAQTVQLATWDTYDTIVQVGDDFDPTLDSTTTCSGCWISRTGTTGVTYGRGTSHTTQGAGSLEATLVGKGNGGEYTATINGVTAQFDTHFDYPLIVTYSNTTNAAAGGPDPRFNAILNAVQGNQGLYSIEFDIIYDVAQMRSIPWQAPEETVAPENGRFPQRFFWVGMHGNMNNDADGSGFIFTGFDANTINPFDAQWDSNLFPVFNASFPLTDFEFNVGSTLPTFFQFGFLYNSTSGTLPAGSNTAGVHVFFDNLRLVERDILSPIDFNNNNMADPGDFQLFMAQHLAATPTLGDYDMDGDNDFLDFQQFEEFYDLNIGAAGSLRAAIAAVPEPSSVGLAGVLGLGLFGGRLRRKFALLLACLAATLIGKSSEAQVIEQFDVIGKWQAFAGAAPGAAPTVALSAAGATVGPFGLKVTQATDTIGDNDFSWNASTNPNWGPGDVAFDALASAVNIGAEHFNLLIDTTFRAADLSEVNSINVTFGLNFAGQGAGTWASSDPDGTITSTIPLAAFNLSDREDQGATSYSAQVGFTADALVEPFSVYIDNIRLVQVSTPDLLTLEINRSNGAGVLKNLTANPISWDYMEIKSPGLSLDLAGWSSLDDQNIGGAGTFIEAGGSGAGALVEASLLGSHSLLPGQTLSLGNLYNEGINAEDIDLEIRRTGGPSFRTFDQLVTYIGIAPPTGLAGDYNDDGVVNAADYTVWRDNLGAPTETALNGNGDGMNGVDAADYTRWKNNFGATGSLGAVGGAVPEPSACLIALGLMGSLCVVRRSSAC